MTSYPAGTRVRVTFVGTIDTDGDLDLGDPEPTEDSPWMRGAFLPYAERVEVIEPDRQAGDVVLDANGGVWQYDAAFNGWYTTGTEDECSLTAPARPLTLLVRDGKPVPPQVTA